MLKKMYRVFPKSFSIPKFPFVRPNSDNRSREMATARSIWTWNSLLCLNCAQYVSDAEAILTFVIQVFEAADKNESSGIKGTETINEKQLSTSKNFHFPCQDLLSICFLFNKGFFPCSTNTLWIQY